MVPHSAKTVDRREPSAREGSHVHAVAHVVLEVVEIHQGGLAEVVVRKLHVPDFGGDDEKDGEDARDDDDAAHDERHDRDRDEGEAPIGITPVIRFRAPREGETVIEDRVQGRVAFPNKDLDDFVILRSDGTAIYNFCVVVDDVDMRITHVIRGDDHLANTPKHVALFQALGAPLPQFAHLGMILGTDRKKLSKRHGAAPSA